MIWGYIEACAADLESDPARLGSVRSGPARPAAAAVCVFIHKTRV